MHPHFLKAGERMKIAEHVYISEILRSQKYRLMERIRQGKRIPVLYCITLPVWSWGVLEIYEYNQLLSAFYREKEMMIVGMAAGKEDALVVLRRIVDRLYREDCLKNADIYFNGEIRS